MPPKPFCSVPMGWLCQADRFSVWIQLIHWVVKPQLAAPDSLILVLNSSSSAQVFGGEFGSRPAFSNTVLL